MAATLTTALTGEEITILKSYSSPKTKAESKN